MSEGALSLAPATGHAAGATAMAATSHESSRAEHGGTAPRQGSPAPSGSLDGVTASPGAAPTASAEDELKNTLTRRPAGRWTNFCSSLGEAYRRLSFCQSSRQRN